MNAFTKPSGNKPGTSIKVSLALVSAISLAGLSIGANYASAKTPDPTDSPSASQPAKPAASPTDEPEAKPSESASAPADSGGELIDGAEILGLQFGIIVQDLPLGHAGGEPTQDVPNRDA